MCQSAKGMPVFQHGLPMCQTLCQFFNFSCQNAHQFINYFSKEFFNLPFSIMLNISKFKEHLGNLSCKTKNLNFDIFKISLRKKLINQKSLTSFSMEHVGLTKQFFGLCRIELNTFFY